MFTTRRNFDVIFAAVIFAAVIFAAVIFAAVIFQLCTTHHRTVNPSYFLIPSLDVFTFPYYTSIPIGPPSPRKIGPS